MEVKTIEKKKGILEIEFDDKVLPNALLNVLLTNKVDAYAYEPHPLLPEYRLRIEAKNPTKELQNALKTVEDEWNKFGRKFQSKLKPLKKTKRKVRGK